MSVCLSVCLSVCMYVCMHLVVFLAVVMRCSKTINKKRGGCGGGRSASLQGKQRVLSTHALKNKSPRVVCVQVLFSVKCLRVKCFAGQSLANWFAGFALSDLLN